MSKPAFAFDGVVRITRLGFYWLAFTLFLGLAAANTGNNSLYISLALVLGSLLLSGILSWRGLRNVHVEFVSSDVAWAGAPVRGELRVTNSSNWISPRDVLILSPQFDSPVLIDEVKKRSDNIVPATLLFERRGHVMLQSVELYCRYPFGLFLKRRIVPLEGELIVLPRLLSQSEIPPVTPRLTGAATPYDRMGYGSDVFGFREYLPGDSLRMVNWKKSARIGRWILRLPQSEGEGTLHVAVDPYLPSSSARDALEEAISRAATLIHFAAGRVVLHLPGETLRSSGRDRIGLLQALALLEISHERRQILAPRDARIFGVAAGGRDDAAVA